MDKHHAHSIRSFAFRTVGAVQLLAAFLLAVALSGCAALSNPVANGLPVRRLPPEVLGRPKNLDKTIPLTVLRQKRPDVYRLAARDILGVWVEGIVGEEKQMPPVHYSENSTQPPAIGYPIPIREDGTVALPLIEPVRVEGMTVEEAEAAIRQAYTVKKQILQPGGSRRIIVTLLQRRRYQVLVIRQDSPVPAANAQAATSGVGGRQIGFVVGFGGTGPTTLRGAGFAVELPAYENDVLNALALTGGLPGFDAVNEVVIQRGYLRPDQNAAEMLQGLENCPQGVLLPSGNPGEVVRIPLRTPGGQAPNIRPEDVILHTGDIVFIEARMADLFYTGGLLPPGEFVLPRDHDLDVLEAIARVGFPLVTIGVNPNNISGSITGGGTISGIGSPSPSLLSVVRKLPGGGQIPIRVDLNRALRDPRERLLVQPGDILILQENPAEAFVRYFNSGFFRFNLISRVISGDKTNATVNVITP